MIELYLSGDSMAQRLPRVGPLLEPLAKKEVPSCLHGPDGWAYPHQYVSPILNSLRVVSLNIGLRATTIVNAESILGIHMRRTCLTQSTWKVAG